MFVVVVVAAEPGFYYPIEGQGYLTRWHRLFFQPTQRGGGEEEEQVESPMAAPGEEKKKKTRKETKRAGFQPADLVT